MVRRTKVADVPRETLAPVMIGRVNRARGHYLSRTGRDMKWSEIGAALGLSQPSTFSVKEGDRPLRIHEVAIIARMLGVRAAWIAFNEDPMESNGLALTHNPGEHELPAAKSATRRRRA